MASSTAVRKESTYTRFFRWVMNCWPLYFGTGGRIQKIAADWKYVRIQLGLNFWTRNYVGTIFGGSLFAASDPFFMVMYIKILGPEYVVWDKAGSIQFKRPGKSKLTLEFEITDEEIQFVKAQVKEKGEIEIRRKAQWKDSEGTVIAEIERLLYFATKTFYDQKRAARAAAKTT